MSILITELRIIILPTSATGWQRSFLILYGINLCSMDILKVQGKTTEDLKAMLLAIYDCKLPFAIRISKRKCKRILASYTHHNSTITIYDLKGTADIVQVAIHEYAHHINRTEWWNGAAPMSKFETSHGYRFWFLYSRLVELANEKGYAVKPHYYGRAGISFKKEILGIWE